jgi:hypothetical protein
VSVVFDRRFIQMTSRCAITLRRVAVVAAIVLLLGQTIAAAHFHRISRQQELAASNVGFGDTSCAICAAHLHSAAVSAIVPALDAPKLLEKSVVFAVSIEPLCAYVGHCFGRAPPASV